MLGFGGYSLLSSDAIRLGGSIRMQRNITVKCCDKRVRCISFFERDASVGYLLGRRFPKSMPIFENMIRNCGMTLLDFYLETIGIDPKCAGRKGGGTASRAFRKGSIASGR